MIQTINFKSLEDWYLQQCNGIWEHSYGIKIRTLDNPGWHVTICLEDTALENKDIKPIIEERAEDDWIHCKVLDNKFNGHGGPKNLNEIIEVFLSWAKKCELLKQ